MIRLDYFVHRHPALNQEEFQAKWLRDHGRLIFKHADSLGIRRYTQVHDWPEHEVSRAWEQDYGTNVNRFDGMATACWPSYKALSRAAESAAGKAALEEILAHEQTLVDSATSLLSFGIVLPVINPREKLLASEESDLFRCIYVPSCKAGYTIEAVQRHWIAVHASMAQDAPGSSVRLCYHQVHAVEFPLSQTLRAARNMTHDPRHFGHAETWSSLAEFQRAMRCPEAHEQHTRLNANIGTFMDRKSGAVISGKEFVLVDDALYEDHQPRPEDLWA